jgi:NAD-dependent dihydropyrimidine dehydrogenase PreA subunit
MPGMFIDIQLSGTAATDPAIAKKLAEVCPVNIFAADGGAVRIVEKNLDECTLCELCLQVAPGDVRIVKLYES